MATAKPPIEPTPTPAKRRTPTQVQRERLQERIERIKADARRAERDAITEIQDNAASEISKKIDNAKNRVANRFGMKLQPLEKMLAALAPELPE
jgi:F0F1-type ATP synthase membrane subunit b/b'